MNDIQTKLSRFKYELDYASPPPLPDVNLQTMVDEWLRYCAAHGATPTREQRTAVRLFADFLREKGEL